VPTSSAKWKLVIYRIHMDALQLLQLTGPLQRNLTVNTLSVMFRLDLLMFRLDFQMNRLDRVMTIRNCLNFSEIQTAITCVIAHTSGLNVPVSLECPARIRDELGHNKGN
jgi:hypothetical protein